MFNNGLISLFATDMFTALVIMPLKSRSIPAIASLNSRAKLTTKISESKSKSKSNGSLNCSLLSYFLFNYFIHHKSKLFLVCMTILLHSSFLQYFSPNFLSRLLISLLIRLRLFQYPFLFDSFSDVSRPISSVTETLCWSWFVQPSFSISSFLGYFSPNFFSYCNSGLVLACSTTFSISSFA